MGHYMFVVCLMALVQAVHIRCHTDVDAENVVAQEDSDAGIDSSEEPQIFSPPLDPQWGPNKEFQKEMHERMQERLADLKAQYEALNDNEKAEIQQKADELREKVAMMPPPPPPMAMCPPPPPCDCEDDDEEEDEVSSLHPGHHPGPQPWWRRPVSPYGPVVPYGVHPQSHYPQMHHQGHLGYRFHGPINDKAPTETPSHRSRRDLARLRLTFSVTDPNEWWQDIDSGRGNEVSDSIASWDLGAATQHSISRQMDHYAPALHIGTINRGTIANPTAGGPADRIFGYNPDFNRGDWHAFKFKPRGQFQNYKNKPLDYFKSLKHLPTGAEFFYNPNPSLGLALTGVSVNPSDKNVYSDKFLSGNPGQNLPRGTYKLEWIQMVPTKDQKKVAGFNMVVKNSQTGKHFRLDNADVNQFQGASPFRQQFNKVAHRWGGGGLAQGPTVSVYYSNIVEYRIDSAQRYFNNYYNNRSPRGCIDTHDKCPEGYICDGNHECQPDCVYPCCTKSSDCTNYNAACQIPALNPPNPNSPSCEYCTALDDGTAKGECKPGCVIENNMCPTNMNCAGDHECNSPGNTIIKKILVTTKECQGCSSDMANEGGAVLKVIGSTQCQENDPPCICNTNGLDHPGTMDYMPGNTVTFISGVQEDLPAMGACYQTTMRTRKAEMSWSGPDGSTWSPAVVTIEDNEGYQRICTPPQGTALTNKDAPIEVTCAEVP